MMMASTLEAADAGVSLFVGLTALANPKKTPAGVAYRGKVSIQRKQY
jgi:hypothetical protein